MKRAARAILAILTAVVIFGVILAACAPTEQVAIREEVINKEFIPGHMEIHTTVKYKYRFGAEGFVPVAVTSSDWVSDEYTITVRITWDTGKETTETRTVTAQEWGEIQVGQLLLEQNDGAN